MVRGFFRERVVVALTAPFVGAATADATRDAASAMPQDGVTITTVNYTIPPVHLVRETGQSVLLTQELDDGRPVIMNFIFTTCETTCPLRPRQATVPAKASQQWKHSQEGPAKWDDFRMERIVAGRNRVRRKKR